MKNKLKKLMFMMSLYTFLLVNCGNKNTDEADKLDEPLNAVTPLELEIESFLEEQNNLMQKISIKEKRSQELANYILQISQQLEQIKIKEPNDIANNLHVENLTLQDNSEKFRFCYVDYYDGRVGLIYDEIGPKFRVIYVDGHKLLVKASDETQVCLCDFENLGKPFYFKEYDPVYGGKDSKDGYCGWVLPVYNGDTYTLYDFDTFEPLLIDCDIDTDFMEYGNMFCYNPLYSFYLEAYDPIYGGHDIQNSGCGFVCQISKGGVRYLVDANDFSLILDSSFVNDVWSYTDENGITKAVFNYQYLDEYGCYTGGFATKAAEEIIPYKSDVLTKKK